MQYGTIIQKSRKNGLAGNLGLTTGLSPESLRDKYVLPGSGFAHIEGMEVHYRSTGSGPPLLLVHGIGSCLHTWTAWHDLLSEDFRVISFDLPGFGLTGPPPSGDHSMGMYMRVIDELLDHLGETTIHMSGNSLGGLMTWNYALYRPDRVSRIVLMNAAGFNYGWKELSNFGFILSVHPLTRSLTHYFTPKRLVRQSLEDCVVDTSVVTDKKVTLYHDMILRKGNRNSFSKVLESLIVHAKDPTDDVRKIEAPALIMWGDEDTIINVRDAMQFKRSIRHADVIIYEDIGHLPMLEIPERSAADVRDFLQRAA
jgi:pimeloyl-ACP methyl ester carboxylesterase